MLENLKGKRNRDKRIELELSRCRIPIERVEEQLDPITYKIIGKLPGPFLFMRTPGSWLVKGPMPLEIAEELYADPIGRDDIRTESGPGENPPPHTQSHWLFPCTDYKQLSPEQLNAVVETLVMYDAGFFPVGWHGIDSDHPELLGARQYVLNYYIRTEVGLRLFVDTLFKHQLATLVELERSRAEPVAA
jgi:hypothetical protein